MSLRATILALAALCGCAQAQVALAGRLVDETGGGRVPPQGAAGPVAWQT